MEKGNLPLAALFLKHRRNVHEELFLLPLALIHQMRHGRDPRDITRNMYVPPDGLGFLLFEALEEIEVSFANFLRQLFAFLAQTFPQPVGDIFGFSRRLLQSLRFVHLKKSTVSALSSICTHGNSIRNSHASMGR